MCGRYASYLNAFLLAKISGHLNTQYAKDDFMMFDMDSTSDFTSEVTLSDQYDRSIYDISVMRWQMPTNFRSETDHFESMKVYRSMGNSPLYGLMYLLCIMQKVRESKNLSNSACPPVWFLQTEHG